MKTRPSKFGKPGIRPGKNTKYLDKLRPIEVHAVTYFVSRGHHA